MNPVVYPLSPFVVHGLKCISSKTGSFLFLDRFAWSLTPFLRRQGASSPSAPRNGLVVVVVVWVFFASFFSVVCVLSSGCGASQVQLLAPDQTQDDANKFNPHQEQKLQARKSFDSQAPPYTITCTFHT